MLRVDRLRDQVVNGSKVSGDGSGVKRSEPEVLERPVRRKFTVEYKSQVVRDADGCREMGEIGALLRREGLYSSQLSAWRRQYRDGSLGGKSRGPCPSPSKELRKRITQLERKNKRLERQLEEARVIVEFQKKACEIMGVSLQSPGSDESE